MGTELYTPSSNSIIHNTKVDFTNRAIQKPINLVQYDRNMPIIAVSLYKNGLIYSLPVGMTVKIRWGKKDRTFVYKEALGCNTERNIIYFDVDEQMTYFHGKLDPIIELVDLSGSTPTIAGSSSIPVNIERNPIQESYIQSSSEYIDLTQAVADARQAAQDAINASGGIGIEVPETLIIKAEIEDIEHIPSPDITNLFENSFIDGYWVENWLGGTLNTERYPIDISKDFQAFPITTTTTLNYIQGPVFKLNLQQTYKMYNTSSFFIRHLTIFNSEGTLIYFSMASGGDLSTKGGVKDTNIANLISSEYNVFGYELSDVLDGTKIIFGVPTLNLLLQEHNIKMGTSTPLFTEDDIAFIAFTSSSLVRETEGWVENTANTWVLDFQVHQESTWEHRYQLPELRIKDTENYYQHPNLNKAMAELGQFKNALNPQNLKEVHETHVVNLVEGITWVEDHYLGGGAYGNYVYYAGYGVTPLIEIDPTKTYEHSLLRHHGFYREDGTSLYYSLTALAAGTFTPEFFEQYPGIKYIAFSNIGANRENSSLTYSYNTTNFSFELPYLKLPEGLSPSNTAIVDLFNVDRVAAIGDSYTDSHYTIKDKAWLSKVSLLSDYNIENFAISGDTYRGQLYKIRTGYNKFSSITWEQFKPTHTLLVSKTNDTKYMDNEQYIYDMLATLETTKGLGAIPIISTEYHVSGANTMPQIFNHYAKLYGGYFIDMIEKAYSLRGSDYAPFWGGSHPGTRSNHLMCDPVIHFFEKQMPRPFQSIKIFRARDISLVADLDNYLFWTIYERAKKFKEVSISHSALTNSADYDNCTGKPNSKIESEYLKLMRGAPVTFDKVGLIDVILPSTVHDLKKIQLITNDLVGVDCYVKDVMSEPYPAPEFSRRFDIPRVISTDEAVIGDKYATSFDTNTYTLTDIKYDLVESDAGFVEGTILICSGNKTTTDYTDVIITKNSGSGTTSSFDISYSSEALSSNYPTGKANVGHWIKLETFGYVNEQTLKRVMDVDKISFLLISDSTFSLTNIQILYDGIVTKVRDTSKSKQVIKDVTNNTLQILSHPFVDDDSLLQWTLNGNLVSSIPTDNVLPSECSKMIELLPDTSIKQNFTLTSNVTTDSIKATIKVWARHFPDIFDNTTQTYPNDSSINDNSFDWADLVLKFRVGTSSLFAPVSKLVGLHWDEIEFEVLIPPTYPSGSIELTVNDKPIQIARVMMFVD